MPQRDKVKINGWIKNGYGRLDAVKGGTAVDV
jgi:hypothetical protein